MISFLRSVLESRGWDVELISSSQLLTRWACNVNFVKKIKNRMVMVIYKKRIRSLFIYVVAFVLISAERVRRTTFLRTNCMKPVWDRILSVE